MKTMDFKPFIIRTYAKTGGEGRPHYATSPQACRRSCRHFAAPLIAKNEVHAHAAHFDYIAIIQALWTRNWRRVNGGDFVAGTHKISVIALIDLRGELRLEPAFQFHRRQFRFADDRKLVGEDIFFLVGFSAD